MLESSHSTGLGRPRRLQGRRALARVLRESGTLRVEHAVDVALDLCDALAPAHENGLVHGQLAPHTVRLAFSFDRGPSDVQIFSLAAADGDSGPVDAAPLVAPEQKKLDRRIDVRVDIWAIAALVHVMVVGRPPAHDALFMPEGSVPRTLAAILDACLAADPERRPASVTVLAEAIASFASNPAERFERLADRRAVSERALKQKARLERRGLADMGDVLDRLDDNALRRARGTETATISSISAVLRTSTNEKDLDRLMSVVRENTDSARLETASRLPSLIDTEEDDEMVVPTTVRDEAYVPEAIAASPLVTAPMPMPSLPTTSPSVPAAHEVPVPAEPASSGGISTFVLGALAVCLVTTAIGFVVARMASEPSRSTAAAAPPAAAVDLRPASSTSATASGTPTLSASALPDAVLTVTPDSLPAAKKKR